MAKRRSRGDGGLHWDSTRERWIATANLGYDASGKRRVKRGSGRTKTEAKEKLKAVLRDHEDGLPIASGDYTVAHAVRDWLNFGLTTQSEETVKKLRFLSEKHVIPALGSRRIGDLKAEEVDRWLSKKAKDYASSTVRLMHACLNRSLKRAMARDKVKRNVAALCSVPQGKGGRPSKALTLAQAEAVLKAAEGTPMSGYIVLSLLTGARTEELRALTWDHVFDGDPDAEPPIPPHIAVWRSVRRGGETKTRKSRRTLALPTRCVDALEAHKKAQADLREKAGARWKDSGLVFPSRVGTTLDPSHVRRDFRVAIQEATGINPAEWTPRELRHSFVSLLSDSGVPLEEISRLVGHSSTTVTELVYRKQIRPVIQTGAVAMDRIFGQDAQEPLTSEDPGKATGPAEGSEEGTDPGAGPATAA
jgi:integrase